MKMRRAALSMGVVLGASLGWALAPATAEAAACGSPGQRACCLLEPPTNGGCAAGSIERPQPNSGTCSGFNPFGIQASGVCEPVAACGGEGQRACCLGEASFGACHGGLVEFPKANSGQCGNFVWGIQSSGVCQRITACGGAGQRACCIGEASFGACRPGHFERPHANSGQCGNFAPGIQSSGVCEAITPCGGEGERACCVGEASFGACRSGHFERPRANSGQCGNLAPGIQSSGVCEVVSACGGEGQRACCIGEAGFGACQAGLNEHPQPDSGQCGNLAPGIQSSGVCRPASKRGEACGPLFQCEEGLFCGASAGFTCVTAAGVDQPCGAGVPCEYGLQCSLALRCSHAPAQIGETCDHTSPCDDGLFCQPGLPQRCQALKKPGEGCSAFNPCLAGLSCDPCLAEGCVAPLTCNWNANNGAISEAACRELYSPGLQAVARDGNHTITFAAGTEISAVGGTSSAFGVSYGQDGRYGCFTSLCGGVNLDVSVDAFVSVGSYRTFNDVGGLSTVSFGEGSFLGFLSLAWGQVFERTETQVKARVIGNEWTFSAGIGLPIPFSAGQFQCSTILDTVMVRPELSGLPVPTALAPNAVANGGLPFDLSGWACSDDALCAWANDDALGAGGSGSAEVTSPGGSAQTNLSTLGSACVAVMPGQHYGLSASVKTLGALPGTVSAVWNGGLDCDGAIVRSDVVGVSPPDDNWRSVEAVIRAPRNAQTLWLEISAERDLQSGLGSTSRMDVVAVPEPPGTPAALSVMLALAFLSARSPWHRARLGHGARNGSSRTRSDRAGPPK